LDGGHLSQQVASSEAQRVRGRAIFVELLRQHESYLRRAARRLCLGNEDRAQDLAQDALMRAYNACLSGRFQEGTNARAWFLRILTNLAIDDYRLRHRWALLDLDTLALTDEASPFQTHASTADIPGGMLLAETLDEEVEQALAMLSEEFRRCVILVDMKGLAYAEAALALNIPIGTVRSRLYRSRLKLSGLLEGYARNRRLLTS
jgi:RNA polymerase sigma-70 factor (ECF subfamily)